MMTDSISRVKMGWGLSLACQLAGVHLSSSQATNKKEVAFIHRIYINDMTDRLKGEMISFLLSSH